jgi:hypothetical protein
VAGRGRERTGEVGDGVGDGERGADALAAAGHVLAEQELGEALLHHVDLWRHRSRMQEQELALRGKNKRRFWSEI